MEKDKVNQKKKITKTDLIDDEENHTRTLELEITLEEEEEEEEEEWTHE